MQSMNPVALATECMSAIAENRKSIVLVISDGFDLRKFPRGELLNSVRDGKKLTKTMSFDPKRIVDWLIKKQLVEIQKIAEDDQSVTIEIKSLALQAIALVPKPDPKNQKRTA